MTASSITIPEMVSSLWFQFQILKTPIQTKLDEALYNIANWQTSNKHNLQACMLICIHITSRSAPATVASAVTLCTRVGVLRGGLGAEGPSKVQWQDPGRGSGDNISRS